MRALWTVLHVAVLIETCGTISQAQGEDAPTSDASQVERDPLPEQFHKPLADVVIEGNKAIKTGPIRKLIKTQPGTIPDPEQIKDDIRALFAQRWFYSVDVRMVQSTRGPVLVFAVAERPTLQNVSYRGNTRISDKELTELTGLKSGAGFNVGDNRVAMH